jgi:hypothetical protein
MWIRSGICQFLLALASVVAAASELYKQNIFFGWPSDPQVLVVSEAQRPEDAVSDFLSVLQFQDASSKESVFDQILNGICPDLSSRKHHRQCSGKSPSAVIESFLFTDDDGFIIEAFVRESYPRDLLVQFACNRLLSCSDADMMGLSVRVTQSLRARRLAGYSVEQFQSANYFTVLGISEDSCSDADVKYAFKALALKFHPDKNLDDVDWATAIFRNISIAYEAIEDATKRAEHARYLKSSNGATTNVWTASSGGHQFSFSSSGGGGSFGFSFSFNFG